MFELKSNEEIGTYLRNLISSKYKSNRKFCGAYIDLTNHYKESDKLERNEEIRKLSNRLSQILKGTKGIQIYDLPVFSELLGVACEDILSAGNVRVPLSNRRTNYNIAFSHDESDWREYLAREDCVAAYADEFGKTVVDYALEFKNYKFLKFLMDNGYIQFISNEDSWIYGYNFGANSSLKDRPYEHNTLENELVSNMTLRTDLISLALESKDDSMLEKLKAREFPPQYGLMVHSSDMLKFEEFYDSDYIDAIIKSNAKVFQYFCEEYVIESKYMKGQPIKWLFPFFDKLIERAVQMKSNRATILLEVAIKHNEALLEELKKEMYNAIKVFRQSYGKDSIQRTIEVIARDRHLNSEGNFICFWFYICKGRYVGSNIIKVGIMAKDKGLQSKIDLLNDSYNKIVNLPNTLIKQ